MVNPGPAAGVPVSGRARLGFVPELNGLRGLAVLFVLGNHTPFGPFGSLLPGGWAGVDIFFVLSGFLITSLLVEEFDRTGSLSLRNFYVRRALRLGPALVAMLIVYCVASFILYDKARARGNCGDALIVLFYIANWVRVFTKNQLGLLAHTWSLSAEEQFYFLWPLLLLLLLRVTRKRSYVVAAAAVIALFSYLAGLRLALHGAPNRRLCFALDSRADTLMVGCILGVILSSGLITEKMKRALTRLLPVLAPLALVSLLAFSLYDYKVIGIFHYGGFVALALLAGVLILEVMLSRRSPVKWLLSMKWLVWVGSVSYGLYLWHWPIVYGMTTFGFRGWTVVLVGGPVTFLIVVLSYYFLEKPILEHKKRFVPTEAKAAAEKATIPTGSEMAEGQLVSKRTLDPRTRVVPLNGE
jgi:peptidoglycan/LPS O-acetylase OafA/YrhL